MEKIIIRLLLLKVFNRLCPIIPAKFIVAILHIIIQKVGFQGIKLYYMLLLPYLRWARLTKFLHKDTRIIQPKK